MANNNLYNSLIKIGLEDYLKERGNGKLIKENWTVNLDLFVSKLPVKQIKILRHKVKKKKNETHLQHNDMFHEISIACAFYKNINFLVENNSSLTPDFRADNTNVEVKTINYSNAEKERLSELDKGIFCKIMKTDNSSQENFKISTVQAITNKFNYHIKKAQKQLGMNGGHVWVVYATDSPINFHENEKLRSEIENNFDEIIKNLPNKNRLCIRYIFFGDLRDKIEKKGVLSFGHSPLTPLRKI